MRLMHAAGFVDILKYYAGAALFTSFSAFTVVSFFLFFLFFFKEGELQLTENILLCKIWITDYQKLSSRSRRPGAERYQINMR